MKLQTKINYRFLTLLLVVFVFAGCGLYAVLGVVVNENLDDVLSEKSDRVNRILRCTPEIAQIAESFDNAVMVQPTAGLHIQKSFSDTTIYDSDAKEHITYRRMMFETVSQGQRYVISIFISKLESEDLVGLIFYFMVGLFALIVLILFVLNSWLSVSAWRPFYKTVEQLKTFQLGQKDGLNFEDSSVYEFEQLNASLKVMVGKAQADFNNLKEFTENASHEIQTPIAVIKSKLESVLQDNSLPVKRYEQVQSAYESASRLSKLNQALLLLSKIENQQFPDVKPIDLCELVRNQLASVQEMVDFMNITVELDIAHPLVVTMNPYLAEILINNLLGNAIKHNVAGGNIRIESSSTRLAISNTGNPIHVAPEKLFLRFVKQNSGNESTGLGLAIASEICKSSHLSLRYDYHNGLHCITLSGDV